MRWSYRKRFNFGPIRINLSRSGIGRSWGVRGARITHSSTGRRYLTLSLPGTGLSWQRTLRQPRRQARQVPTNVAAPILQQPAQSPLVVPSQPSPAGPQPPIGTPVTPQVNGQPWWMQPGVRKGP